MISFLPETDSSINTCKVSQKKVKPKKLRNHRYLNRLFFRFLPEYHRMDTIKFTIHNPG